MRVFMTMLVVFVVSSAWAGQNTSSDAKAPNGHCAIREVYKFDGWNIPGLAGAVPKGKRFADTAVAGVFVTPMKPGRADGRLVIIDCDEEGVDRVDYKAMRVSVENMWCYEFGGKVFAYGVVYTFWDLSEGKRVDLLGYTPVVFYDTDGSGHFTLMRYEEDRAMLDHKVEVPEWVRRPEQSPSR